MADFDPPFADSNANKRNPTATEQDNGFGCGPLDLNLFNGMFHALQGELNDLIVNGGGLTPDANDLTQVRQSVQNMIDAATGGGSITYVTMPQAETRLPIYPEVQSADFKINVTSPAAGTIRIPSGVVIVHRGIQLYTTVQTDFTSVASTIYHVRWNATTDTYSMTDVTDITYNPSALDETDVSFDSTYDDMLIAKVITDSSNVATIENLANANRLNYNAGARPVSSGNVNGQDASFDFDIQIGWARTPTSKAFNMNYSSVLAGDNDVFIKPFGDRSGNNNNTIIPFEQYPITRYSSMYTVAYSGGGVYGFDISFGA